MPDLAKQFTKEEIERALNHIIDNNIKMLPSTKHDLIYRGKSFAPKEVVRWAARLCKLDNWKSYHLSGGENTNKPLTDLGFVIRSKNSTDPNLEIIERYKQLVQEGNPSEIYKWQLFQRFQNKPDLNVSDFKSEISSINYHNLIYHNAIAARKHMLIDNSEEYKQALAYLFDETIDLEKRIITFQQMIKDIYTSLGQTLQHHHDERTISTLLSVKYPEKYPLYKNSFYKEYCKKLNVKSASKNRKYLHYLQLVNTFVNDYIVKDNELLSIKNSFLTDDCYSDPQNFIFAQDILYQALTQGNEGEDLEEEYVPELIKNEMKHIPINQILYGPPGTGKTYNTINTAVAIANPSFNLDQDRKIIKAEYQRLVDIGQIVFTTFHQSMSYEDFVEGIKPEVEENEEGDKSIIYNIKDGIFKTICTNAQKTEFDKQQITSAYTFDDAFTALVKEANNGLQNNAPMFLPIQTQNLGLKIVGISDKGNLKLKPIYSDEAREYTVSYSRAQKLQNAFPNLSVVKNIDKEFREVIGGSNSTAYWAVLNYINNKISENSTSEIVQTELPKKNYILIIDEINRGNVSQIFGELITLIEEDKRIGNDEVIQVTLPYSKTKFGVPQNLYIIGTMNTADKSVEALDAALRRRFVFHEMPPKYEELQHNYQKVFNYSSVDILKNINERIEVLLNRDHLLGHAYFINKDAEALMQSFQKNIIPLLQEYFYGDYAKIGLVLGSGFIQPRSKGVRFANFTTQADFDSYTDQELYEIKPINNLTDFEQALVQLMN